MLYITSLVSIYIIGSFFFLFLAASYMPLAMKVWSLNHWLTREFPSLYVLAAAKLLQSCLTLCDPIHGLPYPLLSLVTTDLISFF